MAMQEIRDSRRLGPKVAQWIEDNEQRLASHPALQSRRRNAAGAGVGEPVPEPPKRDRQPEDREAHRPAGMPQKKVPCFHPNDLPQASYPEFDWQLAGQEAGLNDMTVEEYLKGREAFDAKQASRNPDVARQARTRYEALLRGRLQKQFSETGMSPREAKIKALDEAAKRMKTLAALHNPDMIAGGRDVISDFGDRNINSRIGPQWRSRVSALDQAAAGVPIPQRANVKMNAKLERCK